MRNKAKVEGSICNAYLVEETSSFCAHYFEPYVNTRHRRVLGNLIVVDRDETQEHEGMLSIFKHGGRAFGKEKFRYLTPDEYHATRTYILLNCEEVKPYIE